MWNVDVCICHLSKSELSHDGIALYRSSLKRLIRLTFWLGIDHVSVRCPELCYRLCQLKLLHCLRGHFQRMKRVLSCSEEAGVFHCLVYCLPPCLCFVYLLSLACLVSVIFGFYNLTVVRIFVVFCQFSSWLILIFVGCRVF